MNKYKERNIKDNFNGNLSYKVGTSLILVRVPCLFQGAVGHDYHSKLAAHASQLDAAKGFGGKYGVQKDRVDKSALGWDHLEKLGVHASQTGDRSYPSVSMYIFTG